MRTTANDGSIPKFLVHLSYRSHHVDSGCYYCYNIHINSLIFRVAQLSQRAKNMNDIVLGTILTVSLLVLICIAFDIANRNNPDDK